MGDKAAQDSFKTAVTVDSMIMEEKFQKRRHVAVISQLLDCGELQILQPLSCSLV